MTAQDRTRLESLGFSTDTIARTEDVMRVWEMEDLFTTCEYCHKTCYRPEACSKRQYRRKKLPAELFLKRELLGFRDSEGAVICWPCDEFQFQEGF